MRILEDLTSPTYESLPVHRLPRTRKVKKSKINKAKAKAKAKAKKKRNPIESKFVLSGTFMGKKWVDVPTHHLQWILEQKNHPDSDLAFLLYNERRQSDIITVSYGGHKGKLWEHVPMPYLEWIVKNPDHQDYNLAHHEINRRWDRMREIALQP